MSYSLMVLGFVLLVVLFFIQRLQKQGRLLEREEQMEEILDDIYTANILRDNLKHNSAAVKRLRERFTRQ